MIGGVSIFSYDLLRGRFCLPKEGGVLAVGLPRASDLDAFFLIDLAAYKKQRIETTLAHGRTQP